MGVASGFCTGLTGCAANSTHPDAVLRTAQTDRATRYRFGRADEHLLNEVQRGCFNYFWSEVGHPSGLAKDRKLGPVASIAAVGFQLASLPIGVERGWVERDAAAERAATALHALLAHDDNKKHGMYLHFPDLNTGGPSHVGYHAEASTVDTALLLAGAMVASEYFGGAVRAAADRMLAEANWRAFAVAKDGFISMAWKPDGGRDDLAGPGRFIEANWWNAGDEERLVYFLAVGAPTPQHAVAPEWYYRLKRPVKRWKDMPPHVVTWPGTLFTYFFAHCYIDYRSLGADDPSALGSDEPPVDWFENSRRAVLTHRQRCIEESARFRTLSADRWGLSACSAKEGYIVPEIRPNIRDHDDFRGGTVAPYAAASAIMFTPVESMAAIRAFRSLEGDDGSPLIWSDPASGGYGLADSFNLDTPFVSPDYLGIDHGPMLLAIENVRTGLVWRLFMRHPVARSAVARLGLRG